MDQLNATCRYASAEEKWFSLPKEYFEPTNLKITFRPGIKFSTALDHLASPKVDGSKYIIECASASVFAELSGIRCLIKDDELFDTYCEYLFRENRDVSTPNTAKESHFSRKISKTPEHAINIGDTVFFQQLEAKNKYYVVVDGRIAEPNEPLVIDV